MGLLTTFSPRFSIDDEITDGDRRGVIVGIQGVKEPSGTVSISYLVVVTSGEEMYTDVIPQGEIRKAEEWSDGDH